MRKLLLIVAAVVLVALALFGVAAAQQEGLLASLVQPQIVTIEQAVPVEVVLALPQEDGSVITATAPITVAIALQVKIDGQNVVAVTAAGDAEPAIVATEESTAAAAAPATSAGGELVDLAGIPYKVETDKPVTITQVRSKDSMGGSMTQLVGELTNDGEKDLQYISLSVKFYNAAGELLDIGMGAATAPTLAPGDSSGFQVISSVKYDEVASYTIEIK